MLHVDIYGLVTATTFDDGLQQYLDLKFPRLGIATLHPQMRTDSEGDTSLVEGSVVRDEDERWDDGH